MLARAQRLRQLRTNGIRGTLSADHVLARAAVEIIDASRRGALTVTLGPCGRIGPE